jgi:hypothetical protein
MVETAVEIQRCGACGADVRDGSLFCYNCGASVGPAPIADAVVDKPELLADPIREPRPPLKTAASLRKHRRALNRQPVRVSWERPEGPAMGFIITAIVLTLGALLLIVLAFYLR